MNLEKDPSPGDKNAKSQGDVKSKEKDESSNITFIGIPVSLNQQVEKYVNKGNNPEGFVSIREFVRTAIRDKLKEVS